MGGISADPKTRRGFRAPRSSPFPYCFQNRKGENGSMFPVLKIT
jgi:hypothetical protein